MECGIVAFGKLFLSEIVVPWVKSVWGNREAVRELRARVETMTEQCLEWKRKFLASELANRALRKDLAAAISGLALYMIYDPHGVPFWIGLVIIGFVLRDTLVDLAVVLGSQLLPMTSSFKKYVSQGLRLSETLYQSASRDIRLVLGHLVQLVERIHRRIRDWKWKAAPVSGSFSTNQ